MGTLAETETEKARPTGSGMNLDKALDKEFEPKSLKEIIEAPTSAIQDFRSKPVNYSRNFMLKQSKTWLNLNTAVLLRPLFRGLNLKRLWMLMNVRPRQQRRNWSNLFCEFNKVLH